MIWLESDLAQVLVAACRGELKGVGIPELVSRVCMMIVMASKGYPESYEK